ncbi:hypothetical protein B0H13DRAFT_1924729 [Mycena leptocephala]|nr:hypothetical protein B0H13DRAFT_1924729 [Mycena leptocephala]
MRRAMKRKVESAYHFLTPNAPIRNLERRPERSLDVGLVGPTPLFSDPVTPSMPITHSAGAAPQNIQGPGMISSSYPEPQAARDIFLSALPVDAFPSPGSDSGWKDLGWNAIKNVLEVLMGASVVFPPLQAAVSGLLLVIKKIEDIYDRRDELRMIVKRINALSNLIARYQGQTEEENIKNRFDGIVQYAFLVIIVLLHALHREEAAPGIRSYYQGFSRCRRHY